jgi:hypothetical protein
MQKRGLLYGATWDFDLLHGGSDFFVVGMESRISTRISLLYSVHTVVSTVNTNVMNTVLTTYS